MIKALIKWIKRLLAVAWLLVIVLLGAKIAQQNQELIQVDLLAWQLPEASTGLTLCIAIMLGVVIGLIAFLPSLLMAKARVRRLSNKVQKNRNHSPQLPSQV